MSGGWDINRIRLKRSGKKVHGLFTFNFCLCITAPFPVPSGNGMTKEVNFRFAEEDAKFKFVVWGSTNIGKYHVTSRLD